MYICRYIYIKNCSGISVFDQRAEPQKVLAAAKQILFAEVVAPLSLSPAELPPSWQVLWDWG